MNVIFIIKGETLTRVWKHSVAFSSSLCIHSQTFDLKLYKHIHNKKIASSSKQTQYWTDSNPKYSIKFNFISKLISNICMTFNFCYLTLFSSAESLTHSRSSNMDDCKVCVVQEDSDTHTDRDSIPEAWLNLRRWDLPAHTCDTPARGEANGFGGLKRKCERRRIKWVIIMFMLYVVNKALYLKQRIELLLLMKSILSLLNLYNSFFVWKSVNND